MNYSFGPQRHPEFEYLKTPVGELCFYCRELIEEGDNGFAIRSSGMPITFEIGDGTYVIEHRECHIRQISGSVAHIMKCCSCYVLGATETDPPELTKRQAARLAMELFLKMS